MKELRELPRLELFLPACSRGAQGAVAAQQQGEEGGETEQRQDLQHHQEGVPEALGCEGCTTEIFPIRDKGRYKGKDKKEPFR